MRRPVLFLATLLVAPALATGAAASPPAATGPAGVPVATAAPGADAGAAAPTIAPEAYALAPFRWRAAATPQRIVVARNEWGDLRVRTADRGGLVVGAMIQRIGTAGDELEVRVDERADRVVVEVVPLVPAPRGRVDLTVMVPAGRLLEAETRDGLAEVKYKGRVVARSRAGAITVVAPGPASAASESGSITARLTGLDWSEPPSFRSGSGDVALWVPEGADRARLRAESAGGAVRVATYALPRR